MSCGVRSSLLYQGRRAADGMRGVFVRRAVSRGDLLLSIPVHRCFYPDGLLQTANTTIKTTNLTNEGALRQSREMRRSNRPAMATLFPEGWTWLQRLSPDVTEDSVCLSASLSRDGGMTPISSENRIVTLTITPLEATLAVCVGLRYMYGTALRISSETRRRLKIGPEPTVAGEEYVNSLPLDRYMQDGVESFYSCGIDDAPAHACLEAIALNLRDAVLSHASMTDYRILDENSSTMDAVLLSSLYAIRSRVLWVPLLTCDNCHRDRPIRVLAPGLDTLNHAAGAQSAAAAALSSSKKVLVVRALRSLRAGEEVTVDYSSADRLFQKAPRHHLTTADDWWQARYLLDCD